MQWMTMIMMIARDDDDWTEGTRQLAASATAAAANINNTVIKIIDIQLKCVCILNSMFE